MTSQIASKKLSINWKYQKEKAEVPGGMLKLQSLKSGGRSIRQRQEPRARDLESRLVREQGMREREAIYEELVKVTGHG